MLQIDQAVTFAEVDPAHVDPVEEISDTIGKVPQSLGQMGIGVEGIGDVEDNPLAGFPGSGAWSLGRASRHGGHPVLEIDRPIRGGRLDVSGLSHNCAVCSTRWGLRQKPRPESVLSLADALLGDQG